MNTIDQTPMTWMDVARRFASVSLDDCNTPPTVIRARVGWFGLIIEVTKGADQQEILSWLMGLFPTRLKSEPLSLALEGPLDHNELGIEIVEEEAEHLYRQSFGIVDGVIEFLPARPTNLVDRPVPVVAALSVKGGTGRTTTAIAFSLRWAELSQGPVMLVDADLEAPGVSYLFENYAGTPKISLEDIITLAHSEDSEGAPGTVAFAAERLKDHTISGNLIVLPLRRNIDELASSSIRPEHLSTPEHPFALADILSKIAAELGCCGVVVDVRAGLVPLGVTMAMDPNVSPIIVSTLADQSIRATSGLVRFLSREIKRQGGWLRKPLIVINRVPAIFKQAGLDKKLIEPLTLELLASLVPDTADNISAQSDIFSDDVELEPYIQVEVPELPDIQVSSKEWETYTSQITGSGFSKIIGSGIDHWIATELNTSSRGILDSSSPPKKVEPGNARRLLSTFANQLIAAENAEGRVPKPLVTQSLAALAQRFQSEVPIAVSEGAKGTGKTLAARYFISQGHWDTAVNELVHKTGAVNSPLLPICASIQSSGNFQAEVDAARTAVAKELGLGKPISSYQSTAWLKDELTKDHSEQKWVELWLDLIAWCSGYRVNTPNVGSEYLESLRVTGKTCIAVFEGLEELYSSATDLGVDKAMRAILVSLPQRLRSEARRPIGALIFARRDTVEAAVKQNLDQFRREYASFALSWTEDDVLELAAWLADQSGAMPGLWTSDFNLISSSEKATRLEKLWGSKLGPDDIPGKRTREAYTATWIIAVLSDLRGRLVPRDLVRFLASAAYQSPEAEEEITFSGRLLSPRVLKNSVEPTSNAKVKETEEEISELKPIFVKFRTRAEEIAAPLTTESLAEIGIGDAEIETLTRHGIVYGEAAPYEVPELYRRGLGLRHTGARRSVVNLYRKARKT
ncbi:Septum formation inhibitor-activating ATPase [Pseudomonas sp. 22 E 5]|nr:Septum formation inhibitor-activating ATPase [Pseudomonas sp. 22 E 5]